MQYCFIFTVFLDSGESHGFHLDFSAIIAFSLKGKEPKLGCCQLLGIAITRLHSGNKMGSETHWMYSEVVLS
jgi:hypothetical protein